jgi:uncharacterized MAPEG superfamily protein
LWLAYTAGLGLILWIPFVLMRVAKVGMPDAADYRDPQRAELPPVCRRADRVLGNFVENFAPFAALVIIAHMRYSGAEPTLLATIALWAQIFFWARVVHAVVYWFGIPYVRTLAFVVGWIAVLVIFYLTMGWG